MITVSRWASSERAWARGAADQLPASAAEVAGSDVVWVDLVAPTPEEERLVFEHFLKVHALTLEDVTKTRREGAGEAHLPKAEEFPDYLFVVVNPLPQGLVGGIAPRPNAAAAPPAASPGPLGRTPSPPPRMRPQLSVVLTATVLITHHYEPLDCVTAAHGFIDRHGETAARGPDYIFHLVLDAMVDEYAPVVDRVSARLDRLEARVFRDPSPAVLRSMLRLKRVVTGMRKTLVLEREVLARLTRGEFALVDAREIAYYRNVFDHLVRYTGLVEAAREMVGDLMQTHLAASSHRLNAVMKALAMISTVVLPMT